MRLRHSALLFTLAALAHAPLSHGASQPAPVKSFGAETALIEVQTACKGLQIIKVDSRYECLSTDQAAALPDSPSADRTEDSLSRIIADMQNDNAQRNPIAAASEGDMDAAGRLPMVTPEAVNGAAKFQNSLLKRLDALDEDALTGEDKLNAELLRYVLNQNLFSSRYDEARLPFTNDSGFFNMLSYIALQTKFNTREDFEKYAQRLSDLPRYFQENTDNMRRGVETGYTAQADILPGIIKMIQSSAETPLDQHPLFAPFLSIPETIPAEERKRLLQLGRAAMTEDVIPAYQDLLDFMRDEYAPHARSEAGIGTNPANRDYYKALVKYFTTLDMTPDEVHELGLSEVKRIRAEMDAVIAQTDFEGDFTAFLSFLRSDPQFYAKTPEDLLQFASWVAKRIDGQMPKFFGKLPRLPYGVMAVPDDIAPSYTTGRYWGGSLKTGVAGYFMVNTYDLKQRPLYNLPALALHEGVPGHHHQIALGQELESVPAFRQDLYPNAFGEGWGLYAEKLGVEMGIYQTPYENFGRLTYEMWRACRLVVDTGMHWKGWSREQAEQCFFENSALSEHNIRTEVERYMSWPGQALAYKIGELKILELRGRAENALGEQFSLPAFHDEVLAHGGIPLTVLERLIDEWIARQKTDTKPQQY